MEKNTEVEEIKKVAKKPLKKKKNKGIYSGATLLDIVLGGGYPPGFINIIGDSSSGKSFLAGEFLGGAFNSLGGELEWFYDDVEGGFKFDTEKLYGIDILGKGFLKQEKSSRTLEDFEANVYEIIQKKDPKKPFIYVLDSFDALTSDEELAFKEKKRKSRKPKADADGNVKEKKEAGSYNLAKQKGAHALFRTMITEIEKNNICVIIVSQVKENIGSMFGAKYIRTGGKSLDFYPNVVFWLAEVEKYKRQDRAVGICCKVRASKSRSATPFRECFLDLFFDLGIDNVGSNIKYLYDLKTALGKDAAAMKKDLIWDDVPYSYDALIDHIEEGDLEEELISRTQKKWYDIDKAISNDHRKHKYKKKEEK